MKIDRRERPEQTRTRLLRRPGSHRAHRRTSKSAPSASSLARNFSYPRARMSTPDTFDSPEAVSAAIDRAKHEVPLLVHGYSAPWPFASEPKPLDGFASQPCSAASSSAQARDRSWRTSGARRASASVSKGPTRSIDRPPVVRAAGVQRPAARRGGGHRGERAVVAVQPHRPHRRGQRRPVDHDRSSGSRASSTPTTSSSASRTAVRAPPPAAWP